MFLIFPVTSHEHMFNEFMGGSFSWRATTLSYLVAMGLLQVEI